MQIKSKKSSPVKSSYQSSPVNRSSPKKKISIDQAHQQAIKRQKMARMQEEEKAQIREI